MAASLAMRKEPEVVLRSLPRIPAQGSAGRWQRCGFPITTAKRGECLPAERNTRACVDEPLCRAGRRHRVHGALTLLHPAVRAHRHVASRALCWVSPLLEACLPEERWASWGAQQEERACSAGGCFRQAPGFRWSPAEAGCGGEPCCIVRFRPPGFARVKGVNSLGDPNKGMGDPA